MATVGTRQIITDVSPEVSRAIVAGMTLTQARSHDAGIFVAPAQPQEDARSLEALARWLMRFSPNVAIDPPASIFLDASGLQRIFGDIQTLRQRISKPRWKNCG